MDIRKIESVLERLRAIEDGVADGYLIGQWNTERGVYLAAYKDKEKGVHLTELINILEECKSSVNFVNKNKDMFA